jgi:iron complex outermembrane receptor protein
LSLVRGTLVGMPDSIPSIDGQPARAGSRYLPLIPPVHGNVALRYEPGKSFVEIGGRFADRQDRLGDFETVTPGYAVLTTSAGFTLQRGERTHSITLRVDNALDREIRDHLSRVKSIMPEAGRNISLLYRVSF